ncbi:cupin domain-containing protein [Fulvivirga maritima]|uniref:cupin domain-containing protein n=1 Tax=Fulvivirga maritima TaxID=2904247 RepID=UPI001F39850F|nr:cupin domain-containing protein [Fulvivirga maritima]UII25733.1 cupin domain-containing protein [Fulvivirga maritima]
MENFYRPMLVIALAITVCLGCQPEGKTDNDISYIQQGTLASKENNTGNVWVKMHLESDSIYNTMVVTEAFELGARTNWHIHPSGEILVITKGNGFHQLRGGEMEKVKKGDVIKCPPGVAYWHGADSNNVLSHIVVVPNTEKGMVNWLEPVTDDEYSQAKRL